MLALARTESPTTETSLEESRDKVVERLIEAVRRACQDRNDAAHRGALWRATALLISMPGKYGSSPRAGELKFCHGFRYYAAIRTFRDTQTIAAHGRVLANRAVHDRGHDHSG